jgi:hypothetical protein
MRAAFTLIMIFLICIQEASAGFFDTVGTVVDTVLTPATTNSKSELITTPATDHKLLPH